jgi:hypothetical protein
LPICRLRSVFRVFSSCFSCFFSFFLFLLFEIRLSFASGAACHSLPLYSLCFLSCSLQCTAHALLTQPSQHITGATAFCRLGPVRCLALGPQCLQPRRCLSL